VKKKERTSTTSVYPRTSIKEANEHLQEVHARLERVERALLWERTKSGALTSELDRIKQINRELMSERDNLQILASSLERKLAINLTCERKLNKIKLALEEFMKSVENGSDVD